jgi:hypothetical protein
LRDQAAQAMRSLTNEVESALAANYVSGSRAYGTTGTTPFATNTGETAQLRKILDDNGAPRTDRQLVLDTSAGAALRTLGQLTKVNEAGTDSVQRRGELINLNDFSIREEKAGESRGVREHSVRTLGIRFQLNCSVPCYCDEGKRLFPQ